MESIWISNSLSISNLSQGPGAPAPPPPPGVEGAAIYYWAYILDKTVPSDLNVPFPFQIFDGFRNKNATTVTMARADLTTSFTNG